MEFQLNTLHAIPIEGPIFFTGDAKTPGMWADFLTFILGDRRYEVNLRDQFQFRTKELKEFEKLRTLELAFTPVTDAGLKELAALKQLRQVVLYQTRVTPKGAAELRKLLHACAVILR